MLFLVSTTQMYAQTTRYVKPVATGAGTGVTWADASANLQVIITVSAVNDIVWVAAGTYKPIINPATGAVLANARDNAFYLKNEVKVYGGFVGVETLLSQRNINANPTILSGDFVGNDVVTGTGATLSIANNGENAYHVVVSVSDNANTVLDGFSIIGGNANGISAFINVETTTIFSTIGGGIYNNLSSPTINNCVFSGNNTNTSGGGIYNASSSPTINNCVFSGNKAVGGGGIYNASSSPFFTNCVFNGNDASNGGGMFNFSSNPSITNCVFSKNNAVTAAGGMLNDNSSNPSITNTIVWGNTGAGTQGIANNSSTPVITFSNVQGLVAAGNNISSDPLFVNAASPAGADGIFRTADDGLRIQSTSLCKDTGTNTGAPLLDILGVGIVNAIKDMGAYESNCAAITINPPSLVNGTVGTAYTQTVTQTGLTGTPTWSVSAGALPAGLALASATGIISGTPTAAGTFNFIVSVTDVTCTQTRNYNIIVACPTFVFTTSTAPNATVGTAYTLNAGVTGNTAPVVYSVSPTLPAGLSINTATGTISGIPTTVTASATYTVTATQGTCSVTNGYTFAVACAGIVISPVTLANGVVGATYSQTVTQTGLAGTPAWSVSANSLPLGLTLAGATGVISGTPTTAGTSNFTVSVTNGAGCTQTQVYSIAVACPTLVFTNTTATNATAGTLYTLNAGVTGNTGVIVYSVTPALPTGLSIDTNTGNISGTPINATSLATYTVTATQGTCSVTQGYTFAVSAFCGTITINPASLLNGTVGTAYSQTITQTGLIGTPVWSVTGTLPNGLSIASATGIISGTPTTAGTFPFAVNVTDGTCSRSNSYSIIIGNSALNVPNTNISFVATVNNVIFSWKAVPNAISYQVRTSTTTTNSSIVWGDPIAVSVPATNPSTLNFIINSNDIVYDVVTYYSVRAVNSSGTFSGWSSIVSIFISSYNNAVTALNNDLSTQISTSPNPTNGTVVVSSDVWREKSIKFILIDTMGKILLEEQTTEGLPYEMTLDKIASGLYYLKIIGKDNISLKKIVKR